MGIGSTMKNMLSSDNDATAANTEVDERHRSGAGSGTNNRDSGINDSNSNRTSHKLPAGTGPGTSGKPAAGGQAYDRQAAEATMQNDLQRSRTGQGIAGYGSDAAAAAGGTLAGTHQGRGGETARNTVKPSARNATLGSGISDTSGASAAGTTSSAKRGSGIPAPVTTARAGGVQPERGIHSALEGNRSGGSDSYPRDTGTDQRDRDFGRDRTRDTGHSGSGVLKDIHTFGHSSHSAKDSMPSGNAEEDTNQLEPITHERVRHLETEEVSRVKEHDRHIHHVQHHAQPIVAAEELPEQHHEQIHPITHVSETHANKVEDNTLFHGQVHQHRDTLEHAAKERIIVDKGTTVKEQTHHHVHHVIQPIIEKETVDKHRIHTTIPIHEVMHEAPVVHQSQTHAAVPMEHFLQRGGTLRGAIPQGDISEKVLHGGECFRGVDGIAESLERDLHLGKSSTHGVDPNSTTAGDGTDNLKTRRNVSPNVDQPTVAPARN